ncbi:MAG: MFS transporter [Candidatus Dormibacteraeota bacterium]|nr:MFS transporter [Candidatus Dormibacteraeota bacterium]MBO0761115.1 MFS transporter [Candidatus Dormibacteraeota bacterium]
MTPATAVPRIRRAPLALLSAGHCCADYCQGAVPAALPFLVQQRHLSYTVAFALVLAQTVASSVVQPVFGSLSDRWRMAWLMPAGLALAGLGLGASLLAPTYPLTWLAVGVSGLGIAAFHPEGARYANRASGERRATGMSIFSVGGNLGFALGPFVATPVLLVLGLDGGWLLAVPGVAIAVALVVALPLVTGTAPSGAPSGAPSSPAPAEPTRPATRTRDRWGAFGRLTGALVCRSIVFYGLNTALPLFFIHVLGASKALGGSALTLFLLCGAGGALVAGRLADRFPRRLVVLYAFVASLPLGLGLAFAGSPLGAFALLVPLGMALFMPSSVMVVLGQEYLPNRIGTASGVTLGLAISIGGLATPALGAIGDHFGLRTLLVVLAGLIVVAILFALTLPRDHRQPGPA